MGSDDARARSVLAQPRRPEQRGAPGASTEALPGGDVSGRRWSRTVALTARSAVLALLVATAPPAGAGRSRLAVEPVVLVPEDVAAAAAAEEAARALAGRDDVLHAELVGDRPLLVALAAEGGPGAEELVAALAGRGWRYAPASAETAREALARLGTITLRLPADVAAGVDCGPGAPEDGERRALTVIAPDLDALRAWFRDNDGRARVIALLSPTCPACVRGARAVRASVLEGRPEADVAVAAVWIDVLASDDAEAAGAATTLLADPRVSHFHDPRPALAAGRAFGRRLFRFEDPLAWDVYLFFDARARWRRRPPRPTDWRHQLGHDAAGEDPRFRVGDALAADLRLLTADVLAASQPR